jgi:hypothetical protein
MNSCGSHLECRNDPGRESFLCIVTVKNFSGREIFLAFYFSWCSVCSIQVVELQTTKRCFFLI